MRYVLVITVLALANMVAYFTLNAQPISLFAAGFCTAMALALWINRQIAKVK